jgi:hypothetical protein
VLFSFCLCLPYLFNTVLMMSLEAYTEERPDEEQAIALVILVVAAVEGVVIGREVARRGLPLVFAVGAGLVSTVVGMVAAEHLTKRIDQR